MANSTDIKVAEAMRLQQDGRYDEAEAIYGRVLAVHRKHAVALNALAALHFQKGDPDRALAFGTRAVAARPDLAEAHYNRALALQALGRLEEAVAGYDRAIALRPDYAAAFYNRGVVEEDLGRPDRALVSYDRALALNPNLVEALNNRGLIQQSRHRLDEALADYDRAIALRPDLPDGYWNRGMALLLKGELAEGFALYETRWTRPGLKETVRPMSAPQWSGREPIAGARLLVHSEQGLGDTLQVCRYVTLAARAGADVILEVPGVLTRLMASLEGAGQMVVRGDPPPPYDLHCPVMSLPRAFGTDLATIPAPERYLAAPADRAQAWAARLGPRDRPRVGLAWRGSPTHRNDHNRSLALSVLLAALPDGADYISLQKDLPQEELAALTAAGRLQGYADELTDLAETAALCEQLDLVISVDTSIAHLAGALGRPTWVLLPHNPDWRWMLNRADSPWYPTARLYRQPAPSDWGSVLGGVAADLAARWRA
jgi:Flp pilus assembly protein TadD